LVCGFCKLPVAGKLKRRRAGTAPAAGSQPSWLLYLVDDCMGRRFLVDSGAAYSVWPHSSSTPSSGPPLRGADGASISSWGRCSMAVTAGGRRFEWDFLQAAVSFTIVGIDFLRFFCLNLDFASSTLSDQQSKWAVKLMDPQSAADFSVIVPQQAEGEPEVEAVTPPPAGSAGNKLVSSILGEFSDVFSGAAEMPLARHGVEHRIIMEGRPVSAVRMQKSLWQPRRSFWSWRGLASCAGQPAAGHRRCTWCTRRTACGALAAINAG
jgi:hypothetical protein